MRLCTCSVEDARKPTERDPTGTERLRRATRADGVARLLRLLSQLRVAVVDHDLLALGPQAPIHYSTNHLRLQALGKWLQAMATQNFHGWLTRPVGSAWHDGVAKARSETEGDRDPEDDSNVYLSWAGHELEGILAAGVQWVSREAVKIRDGKPIQAYRRLSVELTKIRPRLEALANVAVVKTYNVAKLSTYAVHGVRMVGVVPEMRPSTRVGDTGWTEEARAAALEARKAGKVPPSRGPAIQSRLAAKGLDKVWVLNAGKGVFIAGFHGSDEKVDELQKTKLVSTLSHEGYEVGTFGMHARSGMKPLFSLSFKMPTRSVGDKEAVKADPLAPYRQMARRRRGVGTLVSIATADNVCDTCQDIADDGPYSVADAYDMFPVHVNCQCAVVPYEGDDEGDDAEDGVRIKVMDLLVRIADTGWTEEAREAALAARRSNAVSSSGRDGSGILLDKTGRKFLISRDDNHGVNGFHYIVKNSEGEMVADVYLDKGNKSTRSVWVYGDNQRKGIATALYKHIERDLGYKLKVSEHQSPDGKAFWKSRSRLKDTGWTEEAREAALAARRAGASKVERARTALAKLGAAHAAKWIETSDKAKEAVSKLFTESNVKTAVSLGIKSALYHLGNLDDPAMEVLDPYIHHHVHNVETTLQVTKGRAHDMMMAGVKRLRDARIVK